MISHTTFFLISVIFCRAASLSFFCLISFIFVVLFIPKPAQDEDTMPWFGQILEKRVLQLEGECREILRSSTDRMQYCSKCKLIRNYCSTLLYFMVSTHSVLFFTPTIWQNLLHFSKTDNCIIMCTVFCGESTRSTHTGIESKYCRLYLEVM
jgi:hypothetical protein